MDRNQIRAVTSTRNSITVSWDSGEGEGKGNEEKFVLQMKDRILGWTPVYSGYKREVEIKCLKPGECFQFRLKKISPSEETDWTESLFAATKDEAIPLSHLFRAVQNSHPVNTKKIISQRPSILNTPNKFNQTPLQLSVSNNDINMINVLLNNGADINGPETGSWRTPLMIAAFRGYLDIVKILIEKGSRWEDKDRNDMTALHYAADNSHFDIVQFAVEDGAQINAKDIFGWTPVMRAGTSDVLLPVGLVPEEPVLSGGKLAPKDGGGFGKLFNILQVIEYLLENGSDVNETDINNQTLLMQAVISGRCDIVRLILSKNADVNMKNANGHTARDMAAVSPNKEMRKMCNLLGAGSDSGKKSRRNRRSGKDVIQ